MRRRFKTAHQGVVVTFNDGPILHIMSKGSKESLKIETVSTAGLSRKPDGLLGVSIRPHEYHIDENGVISVGETKITNAVRKWAQHAYCHVLTRNDVEKFLGHSVKSYVAPGLFATNKKYAQMIFDDSPK